MARKRSLISEKNVKKIHNYINEEDNITDKNSFYHNLHKRILNDSTNIPDVHQDIVVDAYLKSCRKLIINRIDENIFDNISREARNILARKYTNESFDNNIDIYFNEVKREYILNPQINPNEIEFTPENYDLLVRQNLKLVISCAKAFVGKGLDFDDLIQAGNEGLLKAIEKYKPNNSRLKTKIISEISNSPLLEFEYNDCVRLINSVFTYNKKLDDTLKTLNPNGYDSKEEFIEWAEKNITGATFTSAAKKWIIAYIQIALNKYSKVIRAPKLKKDATEEDMQKNYLSIINLDDLNIYTGDCYHDNELEEVISDEFVNNEDYDNVERVSVFNDIINSALYKLDSLSKRVIEKKFGINFPFELSINEISEQEGLSPNKIKYIVTTALKTIYNNISQEDRETIKEIL